MKQLSLFPDESRDVERSPRYKIPTDRRTPAAQRRRERDDRHRAIQELGRWWRYRR